MWVGIVFRIEIQLEIQSATQRNPIEIESKSKFKNSKSKSKSESKSNPNPNPIKIQSKSKRCLLKSYLADQIEISPAHAPKLLQNEPQITKIEPISSSKAIPKRIATKGLEVRKPPRKGQTENQSECNSGREKRKTNH